MDYLQVAPRPVVAGLEEFEVVYAKDQPEYNPLRVLRSTDMDQACLSRWTFTPEQRQAIANGADLFLEQLTFGARLQPVRLGVALEPGAAYWHDLYGLYARRNTITDYSAAQCKLEQWDKQYQAQSIPRPPTIEENARGLKSDR